MAFSKYEPHRRQEGDPLEASTPAAERRARFLRWANWIVLAYTALGFGFLVFWLLR